MKKSILFTAILFILALTIQAQNDTIYIMNSGVVVQKYNVNTEIDSIIFYQPVIVPCGPFTDSRDDNIYQTVTIDDQIWMSENLKYLPSVVGSGTGSETDPYYYVYDYDGTDVTVAKATDNYNTYGVLYNWSAAMAGSASSDANQSGVQGVCPDGWHLPSEVEWTELTDYLGGESVAGNKLREIGTAHWTTPNNEATNESGFTALPGGSRTNNSVFDDLEDYGQWWTTTEFDANNANFLFLHYGSANSGLYHTQKSYGFSVRCVKD